MAAMEDFSFEATEKETIEAEGDVKVYDVPACSLSEPLEYLRMGQQMRWLVLVNVNNSPKTHERVEQMLQMLPHK